jgi:LPXTG-motif cell wall-anchored protein
VSVTDDNGTVPAADDFNPTYLSGDTDLDSELDPAETWTFQAIGTAAVGQYGNVATVSATAPSGATPTDTDPSHYFGANGSIGDFVWNDLDGDGVRDPGEPGIAGITVTLVGAGSNGALGDGDDVVYTPQMVGAEGGYDFTQLPTGLYGAELDMTSVPAGFVATTATRVNVTLALDEDYDDADFGVWEPASIGDIVWNDCDANGLFDGSESGLAGVTVELFTSTDLSTLVATTVTGPTGAYSFIDLAPASYIVKFVRPAGFVISPQDAAGDTVDSDADPLTGLSHVVALAPGGDDLTVDVGMSVPLPAALGGVVWNDLNGDGSQDGGEPGIAGVTVHLYDTSNPSAPLVTITTDGAGNYGFENLDAALTYLVGFLLPAGALGFTQDRAAAASSDSDADPATGLTDQVSLGAGAKDVTVDSGVLYPASLGDRVWYDVNGNALQDPNEPGVGGVVVQLLDATGAVIATTVTTVPSFASDPAAGTYSFENLTPGAYTVVVDPVSLPAGMTVSTFDADGGDDGEAGATLAGGDNRLDLDFGFVGIGVIGDTVWRDPNGNGVQDFREDGVFEAGIGGVTVTAIWAGPDRVLGTPDDYHHEAQTTDVKGNYLYSLLPLGGYQVEGGAVADLVLQVPELQVVTLEAADGAVAGAVLKVDLPYRVLATSESLPHTGTDTDRLAGLGLVLLLGGAFLILVTRKRRENA